MKVRVDDDACVGHGRCYVLAPDVFDEDERGHCVVRGDRLSPEHLEQARHAARNCPECAIEVDED